jgi:chromosome partitioning protein
VPARFPHAGAGVIRSAVMAADMVLVPVAPTGVDLSRVMPRFELLAEVEITHPVLVGVLLTRVRRNTVSARSVRDVLADVGYPVLRCRDPAGRDVRRQLRRVPDRAGLV